MDGETRRSKLVEIIGKSSKPISGAKLAEIFDISRQVIVQDIAILRAANYKILSTNKGYLIQGDESISRIIKVRHSDEEIAKELNLIVDLGGKVRDVFVKHKVYGMITVDLNIQSRLDVKELMENIESGKSAPLKTLTLDEHYHTIEADSEEILDLIEAELAAHNLLVC